MRTVIVTTALVLAAAGAFAAEKPRDYGNPEVKGAKPDPTLQIRENAYAPGIGRDQYGRPVVLVPANKGQSGYYGDARIQRRDAFGPGIHMDQYGRPVVIAPR